MYIETENKIILNNLTIKELVTSADVIWLTAGSLACE